MTHRIIMTLKIIALAGVTGLIAWAATFVDWSWLGYALGQIDRSLWLLAVMVGVGWKLAAKVARSRALVKAVARNRDMVPPSWATAARQYVGTHALGQLLWPTLGMSVRTAGRTRQGLPMSAAAEVKAGERMAEVLALLVMGLLTAALARGPLDSIAGDYGSVIVAALASIAVVAVALVVASRRVRRSWTSGWQPLLISSVWALIAHLGDVAMLLIAAQAAQVPVELVPALIAFFALSSAALIPLVPGQIGVMEAAVVFGLAYGGIPTEPALAAALAYRAAYLVPMVAIGLPLLLVEALLQARKSARKPASASESF